MSMINTIAATEQIRGGIHDTDPVVGHAATPSQPNYAGLKEQTIQLLRVLRHMMYPDIFPSDVSDINPHCAAFRSSPLTAADLLRIVLPRVLDSEEACKSAASELMAELPKIRCLLETDVQAAYEGDPAAQSLQEVMLAYPAFEAISIFRIAHKLYTMRIPLLPRIMTEYAHHCTGIDIHPGAQIGPYFFIDHGTGVVIGETTTIGHHVKLYQGVTLGAKSFEANEDGTLVKGIKRHPDLGNHVVVYAGATILGGRTFIGDRCTIGGNVWLTQSVKAGSTVLAAHPELRQAI